MRAYRDCGVEMAVVEDVTTGVARCGLEVEEEATAVVDDEELGRFWNSRYRLLSRSCGLAFRAMPLEYIASASCVLGKP